MRQFETVDCQYGAPMGRWECPIMTPIEKSIHVFRVRLNAGGYDDGGAYWGLGAPLYCLEQRGHQHADEFGVRHYRIFIRARSKLHAIAQAEIPARMLARLPIKEYKKMRTLHENGMLSADDVEMLDKLNRLWGYGKIA